MLKKLSTIVLASICVALPVTASNLAKEALINANITEETRTIGSASSITFNSNVLEQQRELLVHVPKSYATSDKPYPVLYLLDGGRHFNHALIATQLLQTQLRVPELIIVAITNSDTWENSAGTRQHDMGYAGKDNFIRYIETEVMSYIDNNYRTTGLNTLFGHSLAGYFTTNLLANHPHIFTNYIAASPVLQGDEVNFYNKILTNEKSNEKSNNTVEQSIYFTLSSDAEEIKPVTDAVTNFAKLLTQNSPKNLSWHYQYFANQTHSSIFFPTFFHGMTHVFSSFQAPRFANYQDYMDFGGLAALEDHYKKRSNIYGTDQSVPEKTLLNLASMMLNDGKIEAAQQLYTRLTNEFPQSAESFSGLGQVFSQLKQYKQAVSAHRKAVQLAKTLNPLWQQRLFRSRLDSAMKSTRS